MMHHGMGGGCPVCGCGMGSGHEMGGCGMKGMGGMKMMFKVMPWKIMMHADELGISPEQVEKMRDRHIEAKKQMIQLGCQKKMAMVDMMTAIMRDEIDVATAEAKAREIAKLKGDKMVAMIQAMNDLRHILTPEQRMNVKRMIMGWFRKGGAGMGEEEGEEEEHEESEE